MARDTKLDIMAIKVKQSMLMNSLEEIFLGEKDAKITKKSLVLKKKI